MELVLLAVGLVAAFIFFLPSLIAFSRESRHRFVILIGNLAVGWTGIGWLVVLAVAVWPRKDALPVQLVDSPSKNGGGSGNPVSDPIARLADLAELKKAGVLSEAEFDRKKQEILSA